jgi:hypothetical protein
MQDKEKQHMDKYKKTANRVHPDFTFLCGLLKNVVKATKHRSYEHLGSNVQKVLKNCRKHKMQQCKIKAVL